MKRNFVYITVNNRKNPALIDTGYCKNVYKHKIDTGSARPIRQRFYRTNPKQRAEIDRQVEEMLKHNIIETFNPELRSQWSLRRKNVEISLHNRLSQIKEKPAIVSLEYKHFEHFTTQQEYPINSVTDHNLNDGEIVSMIDNRVDEIKQLQSECQDLKFIYDYLSCCDLLDSKQSAIKFVAEREQYALLDGILYHLKEQRAKKLPKDNRLKRLFTIPKIL
ncbi:unnamed protein product [Mytilus coruscus]|uniref:Uncharacterized protein n=1 Tax=Mytilus coruscus TaxID=42192 RepID=A0A6J8DEZ2_MYTCO|nr:unnamed protein product [Mytilus coruscus]